MNINEDRNVIINFCPTGMVPTKSMNPNVPESPDEIIETVHEAYEVGITIAHIHARDEDGSPSYNKSIYLKIFEGIRRVCPELIICASSSGRKWNEFDKRSEVIELYPDMCSLTLSSLNFATQASVNSPEMIEKLINKMHEYGVSPELECFDLGMISYGKYLLEKKNLKEPVYWNLLFGNIVGFQGKLSHMAMAIEEIPNHHYFSLAGLGRFQFMVHAIAIATGYGVRVGLEDNLWYDREKKVPANNIQLLKRVHHLLGIHERVHMSPEKLGASGFYNTISRQ